MMGILNSPVADELDQLNGGQAVSVPMQGTVPTRAIQQQVQQQPVYQPNPARQAREQALQQSLYAQPSKPQGFWPKTAHILGQIGNIAGTVLLGNNVMSGIPGTSQSNAIQRNAGQNELGALQNRDASEQDAASRRELQGAQTEHTQAETEDLENPSPTPLQHLETDQGIFAFNPETKELTPLTYQGKPLMKPTAEKTPNPKTDLQQKLLDAQNAGDTATAKKIQQQIKDIDPAAEQRFSFQVGEAGKKDAASTSKATDAVTEREYTYTRNKWDKDWETYHKQADNLQEAMQLVGKGALGDALGSIKSLSGLASGQGSGVRITQAELNSIARARGLGGDFQAALQRFGDGKNLTQQQEKDLRGIVEGVRKVGELKGAKLNQALDDLGNAKTKEEIRRIDSQVRHALMGGQ